MSVLTVQNLCKRYPAFTLESVSFTLAPGKITGFIGRNGAGKTTTLKSLMNFVHPDSGAIEFFGKGFAEHELEIKQRIGFVSGGVDYYSKSKIRTITSVTRRFYDRWDDDAYRRYLKQFDLDEAKTPAQLSAGMKVKYALALALSHNAELLILDEPTSGLDPVSRDDLLDVFLGLRDRGITILFSTHITSDLDKCADNILYIREGRIVADSSLDRFVASYKVVQLGPDGPNDRVKPSLIGVKRMRDGYSALIKTELASLFPNGVADADLEAIMVHMEKEVL